MSIPTTIGGYKIIGQIGSGGMATVYEARQEKLDRRVAIKWMHASFVHDRQFIGRFEREARIVARLDHPNIVPIYDTDTQEGRPYLVMKLLDGQTLKDHMTESPLVLNEILSVMGTVASALDYAHVQGILHRDLKPSNILIDLNGAAYLTDFGLARMTHQGESTLSADSMLGTPHYISPEQAVGGDLDGRTDVYSFGVLLYELLVGRLPFTGETPYAIVHKHIYALPPAPSALNPQIPPPVERVLLKALAKSPPDRYPTATALMADLQKALQMGDVDELDAERVSRAEQLADVVPMNTPGGGKYERISVINGRKVVDIPYVPLEMVVKPPNLSWQGWIQLFIERLKLAIEDIRGQLGNRGIKDRVQTVATEWSDSIRHVTDGAVDIQIGGLTIPTNGQTTPKRAKIHAPAPAQRRNIRMLNEDWSADEDYVRRRVKKRLNDRRDLLGHSIFYLIVSFVLVVATPAIQQAIGAILASPEVIDAIGIQTANALAPLATIPIGIILAIGWGGSVLAHIMRVFYRTGSRQENKRNRINQEMTELHGDNWRQTVTDVEYRPIREWVRRRFSRRINFITHGIQALTGSLNVWILLPVFAQLVTNFTNDSRFAPLPTLLLVLILGSVFIHGGILALSEMLDNGHEREIQREIAKEKARLGGDGYRDGYSEKAKNSLSSIDKPKRYVHDNDNITDDLPKIRLTEDGELTESTVLQFSEIQDLANRGNSD